MLVQLSDTRDDLRDFGIVKRWTAAYAVPCQQQFQCDPGIDAAPQQVSGERRDGRIALAFRHAFPHQPAPLISAAS